MTHYNLTTLRAEFFLNTRDIPLSFDSSIEARGGGYPVFSVEKSVGSLDILYPDPIDLSESYAAEQVPTVRNLVLQVHCTIQYCYHR